MSPIRSLLLFYHDPTCWVSLFGSIISYGLIKTFDIKEIPPHARWRLSKGMFWLFQCLDWAEAWGFFFPPAAIISQADAKRWPRWPLWPRQSPSNRTTWEFTQSSFWTVLSNKVLSFCYQFPQLGDWSLLSLSLAGRLYKGHCLCIFH